METVAIIEPPGLEHECMHGVCPKPRPSVTQFTESVLTAFRGLSELTGSITKSFYRNVWSAAELQAKNEE
jgi:hypothetical protein